jgi:hypothetical protein
MKASALMKNVAMPTINRAKPNILSHGFPALRIQEIPSVPKPMRHHVPTDLSSPDAAPA